jgi:hypothetical protein
MIFYLCIAFLFSSIFAEENYTIASEKASFDGNTLSLSNNIQIEHTLGKLCAKEAFLEDADKKDFRLHLKGDVALFLKTGAVLKSEDATFDSNSSKITFSSLKTKVSFEDTILSKNNKKNKITLSCHNIDCLFSNFKTFEKTSLKDISYLSFLDDVHLTYDDFNFFGEKATLQKDELNNSIILFYPKKDGLCHFQYEKNQIETLFAKINLKEKNLFLEKPKGLLSSDDKSIFFSCNTLKWQNFNQNLFLEGDVFIDYKENGFLKSDAVTLVKNSQKNDISKILAQGKTNISLVNKNNEVTSELSCNGTIELDNEKGYILAINSQKNEDQLIFQDGMLTLSAKKASLSYTPAHKLQNVLLEDNVRFIYHQKDAKIGCGIANKVFYDPSSKEIVLSSLDKKKVLFWQDDDSIRLSAKEIHISQKDKDSIKGIGDVRFAFNFEEEKLIKEIFSRYVNE